jgi:hypothetical protein
MIRAAFAARATSERTLDWYHAGISRAKSIVPDGSPRPGISWVRTLLYEAANALLTRSRQRSALKAWAEAIAARCRRKKAKVALARKLAVMLHRLWRDGTAFVPA